MSDDDPKKGRDHEEDDAAPLSLRDAELEPVSLLEINKILAPGRAPAKLSDRPPPPKATEGEDRPRRRLPSVPKRTKKEKEEKKKEEEERSIEDRASDSGLLDLRQLAAEAAPPPRRGSIPDDELSNLSAQVFEPAAPVDLTPPDLSLDEPKPPKPPIKKREVASAADVSSEPPRTRAAVSAAPRKREEPRSAPPPREPSSSGKWITVAVVAAAAFGIGYFVGRGASDGSAASAPASPTTGKTAASDGEICATANTTAAAPISKVDTAACPPCEASSVTSVASSVASAPSAPATSAPSAVLSARPSVNMPSTNATPTNTAPPAAGGAFDPGAAKAALSSLIGSASGCKQPGDPSGVAHVSVTFAPSGRVTSSTISGPPFQGTVTGGCIAKAFRAATVPPFTGDPVTVSKTVTIP